MAMVANSQEALGQRVIVRLLDSALGRPVHEWQFSDQAVVTIGRADESDVKIADGQVSRAHAKLLFNEGQWTLVSLGRNGTLVDDRVISDMELTGPTVFRLGPGGPMLSFLPQVAESAPTETLGSIDPDIFSKLEVDQLRKDREVEEITGNTLFKELLDQSQQMKARRRESQE